MHKLNEPDYMQVIINASPAFTELWLAGLGTLGYLPYCPLSVILPQAYVVCCGIGLLRQRAFRFAVWH
jgi:hypothetical protein